MAGDRATRAEIVGTKQTIGRHNLLALLPGTSATDVMKAVGVLKPEIEALTPGRGVLYQSFDRLVRPDDERQVILASGLPPDHRPKY